MPPINIPNQPDDTASDREWLLYAQAILDAQEDAADLRRQLASNLYHASQSLSIRKLADLLGVSKSTVCDLLRESRTGIRRATRD